LDSGSGGIGSGGTGEMSDVSACVNAMIVTSFGVYLDLLTSEESSDSASS
jgi:hypothetical protein